MGLSGQPCRTPDTDTRGKPCRPLIFTATVAEPYKLWMACSMLPWRPKRRRTCQRTGLDTRSTMIDNDNNIPSVPASKAS